MRSKCRQLQLPLRFPFLSRSRLRLRLSLTSVVLRIFRSQRHARPPHPCRGQAD